MAQITLSDSNSKIVRSIADNDGFIARVGALTLEHALNLTDTGETPSASELKWAQAVMGGQGNVEFSTQPSFRDISRMLVVGANTNNPALADTATDAQVRTAFDAVIDRHINAWVARNP